jgi:two-component system OmpR family sensor kinase
MRFVSTIRGRLLLGLMVGSLLCILLAAGSLYRLVSREAEEVADLELRKMSGALPYHLHSRPLLPIETDPDEQILIRIWDSNGTSVYQTPSGITLPRMPTEGYHTVLHQGQLWRIYADDMDDRFVEVAHPVAVRNKLARDMALRVLPPLAILMAMLTVLIYVVVGKALAPMRSVAAAVQGRSEHALQPLDLRTVPPELQSIVSALNHLLARIEHSLATQRNFVADAAHELRSPLTALKLQLHLAEMASDPAQRTVAFEKLHARLDRTAHLIQQLLMLARHESTSPAKSQALCDLQELARAAVVDHLDDAERKGIDLGIGETSARANACVHVDGVALLLRNLVDNAVRYTEPGGRVDVSSGTQLGRPFLRVADSGPGIPFADRERIFDRFYRVEGHSTRGCGLGLAIVKNVADEHGANIELSTRDDGRELSVTVLFLTTG